MLLELLPLSLATSLFMLLPLLGRATRVLVGVPRLACSCHAAASAGPPPCCEQCWAGSESLTGDTACGCKPGRKLFTSMPWLGSVEGEPPPRCASRKLFQLLQTLGLLGAKILVFIRC